MSNESERRYFLSWTAKLIIKGMGTATTEKEVAKWLREKADEIEVSEQEKNFTLKMDRKSPKEAEKEALDKRKKEIAEIKAQRAKKA